MIIPRSLEKIILEKLSSSHKGIVIYGARQVGKTTLVQTILSNLNLKTLSLTGDEPQRVKIFSSNDLNKLKSIVSGYELIFLDEAQLIPNVGTSLKLLLDNLPNLKIIVTGSSSFDLANKINEPLTGRVWNYHLYPIATNELSTIYNQFELNSLLENQLIFGSYPEIYSQPNSNLKKEYLGNLSNSYLYKDLLSLADIKNSNKIRDLLKLLAFQIGSEVSLVELSNTLGISKDTVSRYLDLLEKAFINTPLSGL